MTTINTIYVVIQFKPCVTESFCIDTIVAFDRKEDAEEYRAEISKELDDNGKVRCIGMTVCKEIELHKRKWSPYDVNEMKVVYGIM